MKQKTTEPKKVLTQSEVDKVNYFFKKAFDFDKEKKYAEAVACKFKNSNLILYLTH